MSRFGRGRGRGGLPIAAPDGASPLPPQPLFPPFAEADVGHAQQPTEAELVQLKYRHAVRAFLVNSPFCPVRRKAKTELCRFKDQAESAGVKAFVKSDQLYLVRGLHAPDELFVEPPKRKAKKARPQSDMADAEMMLDDDDDDDDDENAGGEEGEGAKRGEKANADGAKKPAAGEEEEGEEEPEEDEDEGDYAEAHFDNGEDYEDKDSGDDEPVY